MTITYYAVCNAGGPISVKLDAGTKEEALAAFAALDVRAAIDAAKTDAEDDLDIDGAQDMNESDFSAALEAAGAEHVCGLEPVVNAHAGTVSDLKDGWALWSVPGPELPADAVIVETMPAHLRSSHRAAGNWGQYPHNGAERKIMSRYEAGELVAADGDEYDHIVRDAKATDLRDYEIG